MENQNLDLELVKWLSNEKKKIVIKQIESGMEIFVEDKEE